MNTECTSVETIHVLWHIAMGIDSARCCFHVERLRQWVIGPDYGWEPAGPDSINADADTSLPVNTAVTIVARPWRWLFLGRGVRI